MEIYSKRTDEGRIYARVSLSVKDNKYKVTEEMGGATLRHLEFGNTNDLDHYLYYGAFHIAASNRKCVFTSDIQAYSDPEKIREAVYILFKDQEVAYRRNEGIYTGRPVALDGEQVTLRSNTDFATEAKNGINYVTIDFNELILLLGGL